MKNLDWNDICELEFDISGVLACCLTTESEMEKIPQINDMIALVIRRWAIIKLTEKEEPETLETNVKGE